MARKLDSRLTSLCLVAALQSIGCSSNPSRPVEKRTLFSQEDLGISFELPTGWSESREGTSHIFSGMPGSDAYYTTVTLQRIDNQIGHPRAGYSVEKAAEAAFAPLATLPGFELLERTPTLIAGRPALRYRLRFELHETAREKSGIIIHTEHALVDLSYGADRALFPNGLAAFDELVASISLF